MICLSEACIPFLILNCLVDSGKALSRDHFIWGGDGASQGGPPSGCPPLSGRKMETQAGPARGRRTGGV